jgi:hypothetical protein
VASIGYHSPWRGFVSVAGLILLFRPPLVLGFVAVVGFVMGWISPAS